MKPAVAIVLIERDTDGNVAVRDANGNVRILGSVPSEISEILNDDSLPKVSPPQAGNTRELDAAVKYLTDSIAPEPLRPLANAGINAIFKRAQAFGSWRDANRDAYTRAKASRAARGSR